MRTLALLALLTVIGSCGGGGQLPNGGACDCRVEGEGLTARLVMSWECYCARNDCSRTLETSCASPKTRIEYPACGLTVLRFWPAGGPIDDVFDQAGKLVGVVVSTDLPPIECPSNPTLKGSSMQAGRLPDPGCAANDCGMCSSAACGGAASP